MTRYTFPHNKCKVGDGVEDDGYKDMIPSQDVTLFVWEGNKWPTLETVIFLHY